ncbi:MAG: CCA tRNA nucleotidyltransferase [Chloroflexi bacterium]|nr:CCA tRNA nucleotidyltransferase [Chloroflexota bacterium]
MSLTEAVVNNSLRSLIGPGARLLLTRISNFLAEQNIESYVVGGLVRDALLGRATADIDLAVAADALEIAPRVASTLGGKYVLLDKISGAGRIIMVDREAPPNRVQWQLDFSSLEGNINQDLARRDFTINAMAIDLSQFRNDLSDVQLIDPFNGQDDLQRRVIRVVSDTAFPADAARLLRAVRLAAELGFNIDRKTETLIQRYSSLIGSVAGERIREELLRLLSIAGGQLLVYLDELHLLTAVFPELEKAKQVEQPKEHFWDVFEHSLKTAGAVDFILRQGTWEYADEEALVTVPWSATLAQHFTEEIRSGSTCRILLKLAALLHDIAKPQTKTIETDGRTRFLGHAIEGAAITDNILKRLRFSTREIKLVETVVKYHLRPGQMSQQELPTQRAIYRFFRDTGETGIDILFLNLADHLATRGPQLNLPHWQEHTRMTQYVLSRHFEQESLVRPSRLVDGHDLINIFTMSPGPKIGEILEAVREAQASGEITTREEALSFIERVRKEYA